MRRDWDLSASGHRLGPEPPPPADEDVGTAPVAVGQLYRWLGADVLIDQVAADGSGCRITIREEGRRPRQKWAQLPFPPEAVLVSPAQRPHGDACWMAHDDCALTLARDWLRSAADDGSAPDTVITRLELITAAIDGHAAEGCSAAVGECWAAARAREVLVLNNGFRAPAVVVELIGQLPSPAASAVQAAAGEIAGLP